MEVRAKLKNVYQNLIDDCTEAVFQIPSRDLTCLMGKDIRLTFTEWREKRSLDANAYFYVLVNKIANKLNVSDKEIHDKLLSENTAYYLVDGVFDWVIQDWIPNQYGLVKIGEDYYLDSFREVLLSRPDGTPMRTKDGLQKRSKIFWHIKGSHQMDSKEMSKLIDSTVYEAKNLGIEVMTPNNLLLLKQAWNN